MISRANSSFYSAIERNQVSWQVGTTTSLLYQKACWNLGREGGRRGEADTRISCASQECLVWPGWELYDWAVTHGRGRCTSLARSHTRAASPPLFCRRLLHPQLAQHPKYQVHFLSQHGSYPGTATCTTTNLLLSYCTTLRTQAADKRAHDDYHCSHIIFTP